YEAKTRFDILKTQLEMAFSLTVQLQNISLLRYLK
ncbi:flagellar hook-associated protein FlgL, partial [Brucella intermedia]